MKSKRFTVEQSVAVLRQTELGLCDPTGAALLGGTTQLVFPHSGGDLGVFST